MCGIVGIIGKKNTAINTMMKAIAHRGPDGSGVWQNDNFNLGHLRLSIIDLSSNANQPMIDEHTGNVIVFNGEIYNYIELKKTFLNDYPFKTSSDTEVLLAMYQKFGVNCLQHLRGMYGVAIYDKAKNYCLIARDRLGIKPFYYRQINQQFYFASEIKALLNIENATHTLNELKAYEFLANRQLDTNHETLFNEVLQLMPSHYAIVNANGTMQQPIKYWDIPQNGNRNFTNNDKEEFVEKFNETINIHLRSDVPVGSFVSGGIDSSSIACFALKNLQGKSLHTFSAILPYFHAENALINEVNNKEQVIKHEFLLDGKSFFDDINDIIWHHDEPILDGSMYAHFKLCQIASQEKIKVVLSGSGGDELFGGYMTYLTAHLGNVLKKGRLLGFVNEAKKMSSNSDFSIKELMLKGFLETVPFSVRRSMKNKQLRKNFNHISSNYEIPHFYFEHSDAYFANSVNNYSSWTVPPYLHYEDRNAMAFGVEIRVPFFDHKLIEYALQFSGKSIVEGRTKNILRESFEGVVPEKILKQKGKYGFPSPIDHALQNDKQGKEIFNELYKKTPMLNASLTQKMATDFYAGKGDLTKYWRTLSFCIWYNLFFKN